MGPYHSQCATAYLSQRHHIHSKPLMKAAPAAVLQTQQHKRREKSKHEAMTCRSRKATPKFFCLFHVFVCFRFASLRFRFRTGSCIQSFVLLTLMGGWTTCGAKSIGPRGHRGGSAWHQRQMAQRDWHVLHGEMRCLPLAQAVVALECRGPNVGASPIMIRLIHHHDIHPIPCSRTAARTLAWLPRGARSVHEATHAVA